MERLSLGMYPKWKNSLGEENFWRTPKQLLVLLLNASFGVMDSGSPCTWRTNSCFGVLLKFLHPNCFSTLGTSRDNTSEWMLHDCRFNGERPRTRSQEPGARSQESGAGSRKPEAGSWEPRAGSREPGAGSREPGAGSREPGAGSRELGATSQEPGARSLGQ